MFSKDFIKMVLADKKKLLKMSEVRPVNTPKFAEISVLSIWPLIQKDPEVL